MREVKCYCDECGKEIEKTPCAGFEIRFGRFTGDNHLDLCTECGQKHIDYLNAIKKTVDQVELADGQRAKTWVESVTHILQEGLKESQLLK